MTGPAYARDGAGMKAGPQPGDRGAVAAIAVGGRCNMAGGFPRGA